MVGGGVVVGKIMQGTEAFPRRKIGLRKRAKRY